MSKHPEGMARRIISDRQDTRDRAVLYDIYGPVEARCAGGRLIAGGYVCPHCDSIDPPRVCNWQKKAKG